MQVIAIVRDVELRTTIEYTLDSMQVQYDFFSSMDEIPKGHGEEPDFDVVLLETHPDIDSDKVKSLCQSSSERKVCLLLVKEDDGIHSELDEISQDELIKPVQPYHVRRRLRSCEKLLALQKELIQTHRRLSKAFQHLNSDVKAASKLQMSLLPKTPEIIENVRFDWFYRAASGLAGDALDYFHETVEDITFYLLDVAGHGVPSALLSVTLHNAIRPNYEGEHYSAQKQPHEVVEALNRRFVSTDSNDSQYFTMIYGTLNCRTGLLRFCQAGHPNPMIVHGDGSVDSVGEGGFPVGMLPDMEWTTQEIQLRRGDRIFIYSDGVTECPDPEGTQFEEDNLTRCLSETRKLPPDAALMELGERLKDWVKNDSFPDDVSMLSAQVL